MPSTLSQDEYIDAVIRARIFWFGHVTDGITNGLRGGRLLLDDDDLASFQTYASARELLALPLQISSVCRQIHACLTGPKARRLNVVNSAAITNAWTTLDRCWRELDGLRWIETVEPEDINRFIHSWQVYIFECYNIIRENLKQRVAPHPPQTVDPSMDRATVDLRRLYDEAKIRCDRAVRNVVLIIQQNLGTDFFRYDACLVRDGCFFAAFVVANDPQGSKDDVDLCLAALSQMRWMFSKSDERISTIRMIWDSRVHNQSPNLSEQSLGDLVTTNYSDVRRHPNRTLSVPPLALIPPHDVAALSQSAPTTAYSEDGRWPVPPSGESKMLPGHGTMSSHISSPLTVQHHSPRYRHVSQPLGAPSVGSSLAASSSSLLAGPSSASMAFANADAGQQSYYLPSTAYGGYTGYDDGGDHAHSSSDSNHTSTPPAGHAARYHYFPEAVTGYSHPTVTEGSPGRTLHQSPSPDDVGAGSYY
ncbi:hypothetical protein EIP91_008099 [Steccherinum ochraceum]|uniref:Uncharacterized protein n=1 Tax=Steccherinum ochraceum TaxID=92696 RepID=A0A4V6N716_9APHY|nr:hypothetical protein EIP91_008099 [Steccherinum ochraceum]